MSANRVPEFRKRGLKPACVFVKDWFVPASQQRSKHARHDPLPTVWVGGQKPELADCRWAVGLNIALDGPDDDRRFRWADRLLQDGAAKVVEVTNNGEVRVWAQ
jgi:hypothetical protein